MGENSGREEWERRVGENSGRVSIERERVCVSEGKRVCECGRGAENESERDRER